MSDATPEQGKCHIETSTLFDPALHAAIWGAMYGVCVGVVLTVAVVVNL